MATKSPEGRLTRRGFLERSSLALASAALIGNANAAKSASSPESTIGSAKPDAAPLAGKIALEEHFTLPESSTAGYAELRDVDQLRRKLLDVGSGRIAEMDRCGLEICILSHNGPAIQAIPDVSQAITTSRRTNDYLAEHIAKYPKRLKGFAALPLQDPQAAVRELTRCVKELGFCGALVNGYSQVGEADSAVYYDLPEYRPFWAAVEELDVPLYLHPRSPLRSRQQAYEGHPWLVGAAWGFAAETSIHALRLMGSGLFDEYPKLKVILGHLGEGVPFSIWRADHRISKLAQGTKAKLSMADYLRKNFYITTSGAFHTPALIDAMQEIGADRVLYSVDYPYEDATEAADWFDHAAISELDRLKIARTNAQNLFHL
jgi:2,3-dihydroxybenzoate decarboxylase